MNSSMIAVVARATNRDLVSLAVVKEELGISTVPSDQIIGRYIARASQAIVGHCGREFARDSVAQTFRTATPANELVLAYGYPGSSGLSDYCAVASVDEDGLSLSPDDYELDVAAGILFRLRGDCRSAWRSRKVIVSYAVGFALPDDANPTLPDAVQGAALELIKAAKFNAARDPALRSEDILSGLYSYTLFDSAKADTDWPAAVTAPLERYRNIQIG